MKKLAAIWMAVIMAAGLTACGNWGASSAAEPSAESSGESSAESSEESSADSSAETAEESGRTLVVYFSATGNTEEAAQYIAEATGGDLFELEPAEPYTDEDLNWTDDDSRVVYEHDNPDERDVALVADTVENWEEYDTVFIGYPKIQYGF